MSFHPVSVWAEIDQEPVSLPSVHGASLQKTFEDGRVQYVFRFREPRSDSAYAVAWRFASKISALDLPYNIEYGYSSGRSPDGATPDHTSAWLTYALAA